MRTLAGEGGGRITVLSNLNFWEIIGLALLALFIFGPERLPKLVADAARLLRNLRNMARNATQDLSRELGTEVRLEDLHPKTFLRKHLLSEEDEQTLRRSFEDAYLQLRRPVDEAYQDIKSIAAEANDSSARRDQPETHRPGSYQTGSYQPNSYQPGSYQPGSSPGTYQPGMPEVHRYDTDAT